MRSASNRLIVLSAALAFAGGTACAADPGQGSMNERDVRDALTAAGYTDIEDVERDDGLWDADARRGDGRKIDVRVDPRTGTVYPDDGQTSLSEDDVRASLSAAGYERIRDVRFDDGMWEADAEQGGVDYDLYLDPATAEVVTRDRD
ncbi:MAG: PepSY domain-containing protein [Luteimonas sp.]